MVPDDAQLVVAEGPRSARDAQRQPHLASVAEEPAPLAPSRATKRGHSFGVHHADQNRDVHSFGGHMTLEAAAGRRAKARELDQRAERLAQRFLFKTFGRKWRRGRAVAASAKNGLSEGTSEKTASLQCRVCAQQVPCSELDVKLARLAATDSEIWKEALEQAHVAIYAAFWGGHVSIMLRGHQETCLRAHVTMICSRFFAHW